MTSWESTLFPYALFATTGAYLYGAILVLAGKWVPPARLPWWAVVPALVAFVVDRLMPMYSNEAAPVFCICAIVIATTVLRSPGIGNRRNLLWSLFALAPIAIMLPLATATFFPPTDARAMETAAAILLTVPGIVALIGALARAILPSPRT
jgi:hypothetical protein